MNTHILTAAAAGLLLAGAAFAQSATTTGSSGQTGTNATGGTAGSASAGTTSASTVGVGATSDDSSAIATGGTAASTGGHVNTGAHVNPNGTNGMARAMANDQGTFSKSMTHTRTHKGAVLSRTRTMAHTPGSKPVKSSTSTDSSAATPPQ